MAFQYVLPHTVTAQLDSLRRRVRRVAFLRGCGLFLTLSCVLLIASMTIDFLLDLEPGPRVIGLVGFCVAEVALFVLLLVRPFVIRLKDAEVATLAEEHFPELGERVSSLVELSDPEIPDVEKGSPLMRELLEEETVNKLARCDFDEAVSTRPAIRRLGYGMGTFSFLILTLLIFPSVSSLLLARLFKPWGNYESVSRLIFNIEGADEFVGRGSDIDIAARMSWRNGSDEPIPEPVELSWQSDDGNSDVRPLRFDPDLNAFTTAIPNAQDSLDFFVSSAGSRSRRYRINVLDRPEVLTAKLEITPPGYLGRPRETIDGITGEITIFERSQLSFNLTFNQPVEESAIDWIAPLVPADSELAGDQQVTRREKDNGENFVRNEGSYTNELVPVDSIPATALSLSEDGLSATLQVPAEIHGAFAFRLKEEHGLENNAEPHRQFMITRDQPPILDVPGGKQDRARPTDVYALRVSAVDDVALETLELHVTSREGLDRVLKAPAELLGQESVNYEFRIDLADVAVESGDFLKLQVRATDGRPVPAANEVWSEARYVGISDDASSQGASDVLARQQEMRQEIQDIRDQLREAVEQSDQLKKDAQKSLDNDRQFAQQNKVETLADREADLAVRIAELADQFSQHPLFANLSDDLWEMAAEQLDPAAMLLGGSIDMEPQTQIETLDENSTVADMVEEQLAEVAENFEELADLEEDLLELGRIAQRANQLADDAVQLEERREELANAAPLEGEFNEDRQAANEQIADNEQQLIEEHSQLLTALDDLLQQRPELVEAARDHQLERLAELAERASQIAEPQEMLAESLQNDAEQSSQAAAPLAERQQEITKQVEELAARTNAQQARQPVTPIDPELARQIADELQLGNLDQANELSERAQDDLALLAKELLENAKLPEDPQEAAAELAQRQQNLADDLEAAAVAASKQQAEGAASDRPADAASTIDDAATTDDDAVAADTGKLAARQAALQMAAAQLQADPESRDEQREAVEQAAEALQKLIEAAQQEDTAKQPDALDQAAKEGREAAVALEELAEAILPADQQREEALEELQRLQKEDGEEGELSDKQLAQRLRELLDPPRSEPQEVAQQARQLAQSQEQLREETETLDDEFAPASDAPAEQTPAEQTPAGDDPAEQNPAGQNPPTEKSNAENPAVENMAAEAARPLAEQQAVLNEQAQNLPSELGALERAEALAQLEQAQAALEQGQLQAAAEAQQQAQQALENFAREAEALAQAQAPAPASTPAPTDAASTQPGQQPAAGEPGEASEQLAAQAAELAGLQQELQQAIAELAGQPAGVEPGRSPTTEGSAAEPAGNQPEDVAESQAGQPGNTPPPAGTEPTGAESPAGAQPAEGQQPAAGTPIAELLAQQEELTAQAAQLALQTAQQTGAESPAAQSTTESAQQSAQAETAAQGGQFGEAASQAAAAQQAASAAAESLEEASPALAGQAQQIADQQQQMAAAFEQLENSPVQRAAAQQAQQEQLAAQADEVAQALEELAYQLGAEPLNLDEQGQQAATAQQSAQQGQQSAGQAAQSMEAGNQGQAAQAAQQAAESLRESAQQAGANAASASERATGETSPIPGEFAAQVADAMRQLQEAQQQLAAAQAAAESAQSGQPSGETSGQPGSEPGQPGSEPGQPGQTNLNAETGEAAGGEPVAGQPVPGEAASDEAGSGQPSPNGTPTGTPSNSPASGQSGQNSSLAEAAAALKEAAEMLSDAAQQLAADGNQTGDDQGQGNQPPSNAPPGLGNSGTGAFADNGAGGPLNTELKRRAMKNWGKLSGKLKTEILQSSQRKANGDYARLIKLYFEELAKAGQSDRSDK